MWKDNEIEREGRRERERGADIKQSVTKNNSKNN